MRSLPYFVLFVALLVTVAASPVCAAESDGANESREAKPRAGDATETSSESTAPPDRKELSGLEALKQAAEKKKYVFALLWKDDNEETAAMRQSLAAAVKPLANRAQIAQVNVTASEQQAFVDKFELQFAPTPLVLAVAPNGIITAGFTRKVETEDLARAILTPTMEQCLKAFEENKIVFLSVQNKSTKENEAAIKGVQAFSRDERFAGGVEILRVDPADKDESRLLEDLEIDPTTDVAVTVFFAPPGRLVGRFQGATRLEELVETLVTSMSGFG